MGLNFFQCSRCFVIPFLRGCRFTGDIKNGMGFLDRVLNLRQNFAFFSFNAWYVQQCKLLCTRLERIQGRVHCEVRNTCADDFAIGKQR
ncbi:Uncharacterised protein [Lelliottia amnigena]|nr:Uncharacterised protein [Lelliottia amnigena]